MAAFPTRFPLGLTLGFVGAIGSAGLVFPVWRHFENPLAKFYLSDYVKASVLPSHGVLTHKRITHSWYLVTAGGKYATPETFPADMQGVSGVFLQLDSQTYARWVRAAIYNGKSAAEVLLLPISLWACCGLGCLVAGRVLDVRRRDQARQGSHLRGTSLVSWRKFNRVAMGWWPFNRSRHLGLKIRIGCLGKQLLIPEDLLPYHFAIYGATGSGKSTEMRQLAKQIEDRGDVAIIYDPKGEYCEEFYSEERGDWVLDPTDERCPYWALEAEAEDEAKATPWALALWPNEARQQPFFKKHPRAIFAYLMSRFNIWNEPDNPATCAALGYWLTHPRTLIASRLRGTEHAVAVDAAAKDQSQGLWTTLGEAAKPLRMMPATPEGRRTFTVRDFSQRRQGWIFLTSTPLTVEALRPLQSALIDMLILSTQTPLPGAPKVWFLLDEVATLQQLPQLESGMTKQRASGNPIVLGFHDLPQLKKLYGDDGARTIMSQPFTNIILRTKFAKDIEEGIIGHHEIERVSESRPVHMIGKHNRGRNWSERTEDSPVIMAAEIQNLPNFRGYLQQGGHIVKIKVRKLAKEIRSRRIERLIPPLIFRDPPAEEGYIDVSTTSVENVPAAQPEEKSVVVLGSASETQGVFD